MAGTIQESISTNKNWLFFTLLYLVVDYGRPQDILPIGFLRPGMIVILILAGFLVFKGNFLQFHVRQVRMLWLFILLIAVHVPFARNNYFAYKTAKDMLLFMPFILSTVVCVDSTARLKKMILVCICVMIYVCAYSFSHGNKGSGNYFLDENDLSLFINMWIPFCYFLFVHEKEKYMKLLHALGLAVGVTAVVGSFSRGGFVGLVCVFATVWCVSKRKLLSLVMVGVIGLMVFNFASKEYWTEMSTATDENDGTAQERMLSWRAGWDMFLDNPLGVGGNNFQARFPEYQPEEFKRGMWGRVAHSLWFTLIPELGVFGIIIYGALLFYNVRDILYLKRLHYDRTDKELTYVHSLSNAFIASLAGYFASGTFLSVLYYPHYWYLTGMIVATTRITRGLLEERQREKDEVLGASESLKFA